MEGFAMSYECFRVGDIVKLKSGGPKMTVIVVNPNDALALTDRRMCGWLFCHWFAKNKHCSGDFPQDAVRRIST